MTAPQIIDSPWSIRAFQLGEASGAHSLIESVWREHFGDHRDPFVRDFIYTRLSDVDAAATTYSDRSLFLCAVAGSNVVGTGALKNITDQECELARMFVSPAYRARGIGTAIANSLIYFAISAGYRRMQLPSNNALLAPHRLYKQLGFVSATAWEPNGEAHSHFYTLSLDDRSR